jgi:hypothetical protein
VSTLSPSFLPLSSNRDFQPCRRHKAIVSMVGSSHMRHEAVIRITGFQLHSDGFFPVLLFFVSGEEWRYHSPRPSMSGFITFLEEMKKIRKAGQVL